MKTLLDHLRWRIGWTPEARCQRILRRVPLQPGDVTVDCGANVGDMTAILARNGATVHAFEPNPHAYAVLAAKFVGQPNVVCHNAAVGTSAGRLALYLHKNSDQDEVLWSNGSSLLADKPNVSRARSVEVDVVDLAEFLQSLSEPVKVLKIDIEGAEVDLMNHLLDTKVLVSIAHVFVETHDAKIPSLAGPTKALRKRLADSGLTQVNLDWV